MRFYQIFALFFSFFFFAAANQLIAKKPAQWLCVYAHIPMEKLLATGAELMVLDPDAYSASEIRMLTAKNIRVLAYLSAGEAESYRSYYPAISDSGLVLNENPDWKENFAVKFWSEDWCKTLQNYSNEILNKGFNGLFVDVVDAWQLAPDEDRQQRKAEMEALLLNLAQKMHAKIPDSWMVIQNSHELLENPMLLAAVAGINQESLFASWASASIDKDWQKEKIVALEKIRRQGKLVTLIEYTRNRIDMARIRMKASMHGFLPYFTVKELDQVFRDRP